MSLPELPRILVAAPSPASPLPWVCTTPPTSRSRIGGRCSDGSCTHTTQISQERGPCSRTSAPFSFKERTGAGHLLDRNFDRPLAQRCPGENKPMFPFTRLFIHSLLGQPSLSVHSETATCWGLRCIGWFSWPLIRQLGHSSLLFSLIHLLPTYILIFLFTGWLKKS